MLCQIGWKRQAWVVNILRPKRDGSLLSCFTNNKISSKRKQHIVMWLDHMTEYCCIFSFFRSTHFFEADISSHALIVRYTCSSNTQSLESTTIPLSRIPYNEQFHCANWCPQSLFANAQGNYLNFYCFIVLIVRFFINIKSLSKYTPQQVFIWNFKFSSKMFYTIFLFNYIVA